MNLLDLQVSISVKWDKAKKDVEDAKNDIIDEAESLKDELAEVTDEIKNSFEDIAGEGFFSSFKDILGDESKLLSYGTLISTALSWVGLGIMATAESAKEAAAEYVEYQDSLIMTQGPIEDMQANLELLRQRYADLTAELEASGGIGFDMKERFAISGAIEAQEIAMVEAAVQNLVNTYESAKVQVSGWFAPFQEAAQIQSASLDTMAANIQSQIDYNKQYQQSLETLTDAGYGELAARMQELGKSGAGYLQAFAEAVSEGDTEAINSIQTLMEELSASQDSLAGTITDTSGAFDTLISTIETATGEPFQIVLEDNANDVAAAVQTAIGSIPNETFKYINVITQYSSRSSGTADGYNAQGLDYVPFDGFVSSLHKGERILTAGENREYTKNKGMTPQNDPEELTLDITLELDGAVLARKLYRHNQTVANDHGQSLVRR